MHRAGVGLRLTNLLATAPLLLGLQLTVTPAQLGNHLPDTPAGWSGPNTEELQAAAAGNEVNQISAVYAGPGGAQATLFISASRAMVGASRAMGMVFRTDSMIEMMNKNSPDKHYTRVDENGFTGWTLVDKGKGETELTAFNEDILVKLEIDRADADALQAFQDGIDWSGLGGLLAPR